jgi:transcriptional regulator with XRE-family HTH domain
MEKFSEWLGRRIRESGWETLREASEHLGVHHSSLSRYLNGDAGPSRQNLKKIAAALDADRDAVEAMVDAQDQATATPQGIPADVAFAGAPQGFGDMVWERLSPAARAQIVEIVRTEMEEEAEQAKGG